MILAYDCKGKPDGYHKDPDNAHKFFQCSGGQAFAFTCPENLVFDETAKACTFGGGTDPTATTHKVETTPPPHETTKPNTQSTPHSITTKETATHPTDTPTHPTAVTPTQSGTTAAQTTKGPVVTTPTATEAPKGSTNTLRIRHTTPPS
jgi:hypothetical protein